MRSLFHALSSFPHAPFPTLYVPWALHMFPGMSDEDVERIITYLKKSVNKSN
jgi:cytochrome c2